MERPFIQHSSEFVPRQRLRVGGLLPSHGAIDHYLCVVDATHFWMSLLATLDGFIECENRSDVQMGASTLAVPFCHPTPFFID
jgi:hypothetical protein